MQDKIIEAIAAKLQQYDTLNSVYDVEEIAKSIYAAIAPHLGAGEPDWKDAPEWAEFRTTDKHGAVLYWQHKPIPDGENGFWVHPINDPDGEYEYSNHFDSWKESLQRRPQ